MKKSKKIASLILLGILISSILGFGVTALGIIMNDILFQSYGYRKQLELGPFFISIAIIFIGIILINPFIALLQKRVFTREENMLLTEFNGLVNLKNKNLISKEDFTKKEKLSLRISLRYCQLMNQ